MELGAAKRLHAGREMCRVQIRGSAVRIGRPDHGWSVQD
jgi:hypothetical protein